MTFKFKLITVLALVDCLIFYMYCFSKLFNKYVKDGSVGIPPKRDCTHGIAPNSIIRIRGEPSG